MVADGDRVERESIGELFSRAVADGKAFAAAQVEVVKQTALTGIDKAKFGVALIVGGGLLAYAALIVLLIAIFTWLLDMIGPIGAGLAVTLGTLAIAFAMVKVGIGKLSGATASVKGQIK